MQTCQLCLIPDTLGSKLEFFTLKVQGHTNCYYEKIAIQRFQQIASVTNQESQIWEAVRTWIWHSQCSRKFDFEAKFVK